ncbi:hypothetical protein AB7M47_006250 [Bradyrhizobium elkanii]|nr:hypothetical protein [Bradyrhizobium elkanii]WLA44990.1 hypothetical protein QIH80_23925 [Bradyrhizobium elkanii]WLB84881.1 hypothetical protein QIH83_20970 [Bradyrhizobium elkanii]
MGKADGHQCSGCELPRPRERLVECGFRVGSNDQDICDKRCDEDQGKGSGGGDPPSHQRPQQQRPDKIELFLDAERPEMEQRLRLRGRIEIATLRIEQQVCRETRACRNLLSKGHQLARHQKLPSGDEGGDQDDDQGGKNPANATRIERRKAEAPVLNVAIDDPGDQVAGNDEEDIDPDKTPGNILRERVAEHDQRDGNGPQAVDIRPIILVVVPHRPLAPVCVSP